MSKSNKREIRVTKEIKIMAAMHKARYGKSMRDTIIPMGEAEYAYRKFGRLVIGKGRGDSE